MKAFLTFPVARPLGFVGIVTLGVLAAFAVSPVLGSSIALNIVSVILQLTLMSWIYFGALHTFRPDLRWSDPVARVILASVIGFFASIVISLFIKNRVIEEYGILAVVLSMFVELVAVAIAVSRSKTEHHVGPPRWIDSPFFVFIQLFYWPIGLFFLHSFATKHGLLSAR